jgi:HSP20 family protein
MSTMSDLSRWEPTRELTNLRTEMDRLFRDWLGGRGAQVTTAGGWAPALDVEETDDAYELHVELPGVKPEDLEVSLDEGVLTISGERKFYDEKSSEGFHRIERSYGRFHRAVRLPGQVEADQIQANFRDGILEIRVPKAPESKPHRIQVKAES